MLFIYHAALCFISSALWLTSALFSLILDNNYYLCDRQVFRTSFSRKTLTNVSKKSNFIFNWICNVVSTPGC